MFFKKKGAKAASGTSEVPVYAMMINGAAVETDSIETVVNPFDLSPVGRHSAATLATLDDAVNAATAAFPDWAARSDQERADACMKIAQVLEANAQELSVLITKEQGKPVDAGGFGSGFEVGGCIGWSQAAAAMTIEDKTLVDADGVKAVQKRVPMGVVGSITPWNWPVLIAIWHIVPAIRAGNTVVIKPSELTPLSTLRAVELINTVLPAGVLNVVTGGGEIGEAMTKHPGFAKLVFTGSTATGKRVMSNAAHNLASCTLELGGNDPAIVLPGAPVADMAPGLFFGSFLNAGQTCGCIKRIYVHEDDYQAACDALSAIAAGVKVGDGLQAETDMGPIQNKAQYDKVKQITQDAVNSGARLLVGGEQVGEGYALTPAILADCKAGMAIVDEEQFGPVVPLVPYSTLEDAIAQANATEFGLCASVWGTDPELLTKVSNELVAGTVYVNTHAELNPMVPFGGVKASGIGFQFGQEGLHALTNTKIVYQRSPG